MWSHTSEWAVIMFSTKEIFLHMINGFRFHSEKLGLKKVLIENKLLVRSPSIRLSMWNWCGFGSYFILLQGEGYCSPSQLLWSEHHIYFSSSINVFSPSMQICKNQVLSTANGIRAFHVFHWWLHLTNNICTLISPHCLDTILPSILYHAMQNECQKLVSFSTSD